MLVIIYHASEHTCIGTSAITMKNTDDFHYEGKPPHAAAKSTLFTVIKDEWDARRTLVSP